MARYSAGLLMYRQVGEEAVEVFLVHPGGPIFVKKDAGAWSVPKGEYLEGEEPVAAARREFEEETGFVAGEPLLELGWIKQKGGKTVYAWAFEGDCDPAELVSNRCEVEWPPRSGRVLEIPEVDRGEWFGMEEARVRMVASQTLFLDRLRTLLAGEPTGAAEMPTRP